jgi:hypothetical protein
MQLVAVLWIVLQPVMWPINLPQYLRVFTDYCCCCVHSGIRASHQIWIIRSTSFTFIIAYFPFQVHKWPIVGSGYHSTPTLLYSPSYPIVMSFWDNVPRYILQSRASSISSSIYRRDFMRPLLFEVHSPLPFSAHFASTSCWASIASFSHQSITYKAVVVPLALSTTTSFTASHLRRFHVRFSIWRAWLVQQPTIMFEIRCYPAQVPYSYALQAIQTCAPSK